MTLEAPTGRPMPAPDTSPGRSPLFRMLRAGYVLTGRVSSIIVTLLVLRLAGTGPAAGQFVVAFALAAYLVNTLVPSVETQSVAVLTKHPEALRSIVVTALLLGVALAGTLAVVAVGVAAVAPAVGTGARAFAVLVLALPGSLVFACLQGGSNSRREWWLPSHLSVGRIAVFVGLAVALFPHSGLVGIAWAFALAETLRAMAALWLVPGAGAVSRAEVTRFGRSLVHVAPSTALTGANPVVDRMVAAHGVGNVVLLDLAERLSGALLLGFTHGILPFRFVDWASDAEDPAATARSGLRIARRAAVAACAVILPGVGLVAAAARLLVPEHAGTVVLCGALYLCGLPALVAIQVMARFLILTGRSPLLLVTATSQVTANLGLDLLLGRWWGLPGIAAASAVTAWLAGALFGALLRRGAR